jgi:hypothetical protein
LYCFILFVCAYFTVEEYIYQEWMKEFVPDFVEQRKRIMKLVNQIKQQTANTQ